MPYTAFFFAFVFGVLGTAESLNQGEKFKALWFTGMMLLAFVLVRPSRGK